MFLSYLDRYGCCLITVDSKIVADKLRTVWSCNLAIDIALHVQCITASTVFGQRYLRDTYTLLKLVKTA